MSKAHDQKIKGSRRSRNRIDRSVKRVLKDDERKVFELLVSSGGKMLQRDISRQTGFSRVKTHRVLYRLAARGIVTAEKHYNTYEITLADWLFPKK